MNKQEVISSFKKQIDSLNAIEDTEGYVVEASRGVYWGGAEVGAVDLERAARFKVRVQALSIASRLEDGTGTRGQARPFIDARKDDIADAQRLIDIIGALD